MRVAAVVFIIASAPHGFTLSRLAEFLSCGPCLLVFRMPQREDLSLVMVLEMMPSHLLLGPWRVGDGNVGSGRLATLGHIIADLVTPVLLTSLTAICAVVAL